jgi:hypothetical protein
MIEQAKAADAWMETAGVVNAIVTDPESHWLVEDGAAAIENLLIGSTTVGYGVCW